MTEIAAELSAPDTRAAPADAIPAIPRRGGTDAEAAIKSLAKALAQDTAAPIANRHLRAEVRTACYNQAVAVLRHLQAQQAAQRHRYRRLLSLLGGTAAVLAAALAISLLV